MLRPVGWMTWLFAMTLFYPSFVHAQLSTRGTITGTVTDSTGAVVQDATVTITDEATEVRP